MLCSAAHLSVVTLRIYYHLVNTAYLVSFQLSFFIGFYFYFLLFLY